jgi:hypothetical protein
MGSRHSRGKSRGIGREPSDWVQWLKNISDEIREGSELVRRLREALDIAEGRSESQASSSNREATPYAPGANLKSPSQMARDVPLGDLRRLLEAAEIELAEWGRPLWRARGHTLKLRKERAEYLDFAANFDGPRTEAWGVRI